MGPGTAQRIMNMAMDSTKKGFFTYLQILVAWVNANPRILNPQELDMSGMVYEEPEADKDYEIRPHYSYGINRPNRASLTCGMRELMSNLQNEDNGTFGADGISIIQDTRFMPDLSMTFSRNAFNGPMPNIFSSPMGIMVGGGLIPNYNMSNSRAFGTSAYENMIKMLERQLIGNDKRSRFTQKTRDTIRTRLDTMRDSNEQLMKASKNLAESLYYYKKFQGKLDTFTDLEDIKKKQYILMDKTAKYNNSMSDVGQIITRLADMIEQRQGHGVLDPNTYRPLTANVHDVSFVKKF